MRIRLKLGLSSLGTGLAADLWRGCLWEERLDTIKLRGFFYWQSGSHTLLTLPYFLGNVQLSPNRTRKPTGEAVFLEGPSQCEMRRSLRKGGLQQVVQGQAVV